MRLMVFFMVGFCVFFICAPYPAFAQTPQSPSQTAEQQIDELLGQGKAIQMPTTIQGFAHFHYRMCMNYKHPFMDTKNQERFCRCTQDEYRKNMDIPQSIALNSNTSETAFQKSRLLMFVYSPCVENSLRRVLMGKCMGKYDVKDLMSKKGASCSCRANGIAKDVADKNEKLIEGLILNRRKYDSPLDVVMNVETILLRTQYHTNVCQWKVDNGL